jgi:hypothetical protein
VVESKKNDSAVVESEVERNEPEGDRTQAQGESRYGEVYVRKKRKKERVMPTMSLMSNPLPSTYFDS